MKGFLIFIVGTLVGALASFVLVSGLMTGVGAGVGIATGVKAGACMTVEAARDRGLLTAEQVDEVLSAAGSSISAAQPDAVTEGSGLTEQECRQLIAKMKADAQSAQ